MLLHISTRNMGPQFRQTRHSMLI